MKSTDLLIHGLRMHHIEVIDRRGHLPLHAEKHYSDRPLAGIKGLCTHHSVTAADLPAVHAIARGHVERRDWPGIGYTACIIDRGAVVICWDLEALVNGQGIQGSDRAENSELVAVCLLGHFTDLRGPTMAQIHAWSTLHRVCRDIFGWEEVAAHGLLEGAQTACPGPSMRALIKGMQ